MQIQEPNKQIDILGLSLRKNLFFGYLPKFNKSIRFWVIYQEYVLKIL